VSQRCLSRSNDALVRPSPRDPCPELKAAGNVAVLNLGKVCLK